MILVASNLVFSCGLVQGFGRILIGIFTAFLVLFLVVDCGARLGNRRR